MDRYIKLEKNGGKVGEGTYGVVYKAKDKETGDFVALKRIRLEIEEQGIPSTTLREISVLKQLSHENIVSLLDVVQSDNKLYLVFEFVNKDLKKYYESVDGFLSPQEIKSFAFQMLRGIYYIHIRGILHRDLKPQNILISSNGVLKIADFGLARSFIPPVRPYTHEVVTLWYRAPEILLGSKNYSIEVDLWSIGTIIAEIIMKKPLLPGNSEIDEIFRIFRLFGTPNESTWPGVTQLNDWNYEFPQWPTLNLASYITNVDEEGIHLLEQLLALDPRRRCTALQAIQHPFFREFTS